MTDLSHIHRFVAGRADVAPILALHGTGGDESDLIPLAQALSPGAAIVSPRGKVTERGMPRFFRRLAEGVFDAEDVRRRAGELASFVAEARAAYGLAAPIALGFSNGANIAAAILQMHPGVLAGAVLIRAMDPFQGTPPANADLKGTPILVLSGVLDPIVPAADVAGLVRRLQDQGADVVHRTLPAGHQLTGADVDLAAAWFAARTPAPAVS